MANDQGGQQFPVQLIPDMYVDTSIQYQPSGQTQTGQTVSTEGNTMADSIELGKLSAYAKGGGDYGKDEGSESNVFFGRNNAGVDRASVASVFMKGQTR